MLMREVAAEVAEVVKATAMQQKSRHRPTGNRFHVAAVEDTSTVGRITVETDI